MTVLKSFELNGNKQSFANWISNLSPCETPFASMIGKESIDQAIYSWQTDKLAPAIKAAAPGYEEGSLVEFPQRESTTVHQNYTSILRKVVHVSDTAELVATHGRGSETQYQMKKAGKEMMRDLELMLLHRVNGNPGLPNSASRFAGFEGLTAGLNMHDGDTGAVVHKEAVVSGGAFSRIGADDIFDITYNLYLAGSKADKIMFHPKHAPAFSAMINDDKDTPGVFRMFDGLDTTFNTQVKRIKDPLGRFYTLVPNRHMPEDKIFFFNEADWTQTVLRSPSVSKLGKKGASERYLMEMEVGLRHRHPFASGILALKTVTVHNLMPAPRALYTAGITDGGATHTVVTYNGVGEGGVEVSFHTSDPSILTFADPHVMTDATGKAETVSHIHDKTGVVRVWTVAKGVKSEVHDLVVGAPHIQLNVNNDKPMVNEDITFTAQLTKAQGGAMPEGYRVNWYSFPSNFVEFSGIHSEVEAGGLAVMTAKALRTDSILVQATTKHSNSNRVYLNYVPEIYGILPPVITPNTMITGEQVSVTVDVVDHQGVGVQDVPVTWVVDNPAIGATVLPTSTSDAAGVATVQLTGLSKGTTNIYATAQGVTSSRRPFFVDQGAKMDFQISPQNPLVGEEVTVTVHLTGNDGSDLKDVPLKLTCDIATQGFVDNDGSTDNNGIYEYKFTPLANSEYTITADVVIYGLSQTKVVQVGLVTAGASLKLDLNPLSVRVGEPFVTKVTATGADGNPLAGAIIRIHTDPTWNASVIPDLVADANGEVSLSLRPANAGNRFVGAQIVGSTPLIEVNPKHIIAITS